MLTYFHGRSWSTWDILAFLHVLQRGGEPNSCLHIILVWAVIVLRFWYDHHVKSCCYSIDRLLDGDIKQYQQVSTEYSLIPSIMEINTAYNNNTHVNSDCKVLEYFWEKTHTITFQYDMFLPINY